MPPSPSSSSSSSSCSHWWHAPVYLAATAALIIAAISSSSSPLPPHNLISSLHLSGFHLTALNIQLSPFLTFSSSSTFTLFALPDSSLSHLPFTSVHHLLLLHSSSLSLPSSTLSSLPRGTQIPSLLLNHNLTVVNSTVNGVLITHPDLFVSGPHVVHGVSGAFPADFQLEHVRWDRVTRALRLKGYAAFAMALNAVLDSMPAAVERATVFAPWDGFDGYVTGGKRGLVRAVKRHVALGRVGEKELAGKRVGEGMETMERGWGIWVTDGNEVNGVAVRDAEVYADDQVVVHGVARSFVAGS